MAIFSTDGSLIASGDYDSLRLWDVQSTALIANLDLLSPEPILGAAFAHQLPRLTTVKGSGRVQVWNLPRDRWARPLPGHRASVRGKYLSDGDQIVTADEGENGIGRLRIWSAKDGEIIRSSEIEWDSSCDLAATDDGTRLAFLSRDGNLRIADVQTGKVQLVIESRDKLIRDLSFSPDGQRIASASQDGGLRLWSADDGAPVRVAFRDFGGDTAQAVAFAPDGSHLVTGGVRGPIRVWNSSNGHLERELPVVGAHRVAYSPNGHRIIGGGGLRSNTTAWNADSGTLLSRFEGTGSVIIALSISPDSTLAATMREDGKINIVNAATGVELRTIDGPTRPKSLSFEGSSAGQSLEFSPDGKRLLATGDGYALIWNVELDQRSPAEVDALVAAKSPWRLVDGRITRAAPKMR